MRDDFPAAAIEALAKRVGVRCSNPGCRRPTSGPRTDSAKVVNIGVAAHITAAAAGGPRYDAKLKEAERSHPNNGIWLCQNCAKLIDNDLQGFQVGLLREWKASSEAQALAVLTGEPSNERDIATRAEASIGWRKISITGEHHDYRLELAIANHSTKSLSEFHIDLVFPTKVLNAAELHPLFIPAQSDRQSSFFRYAASARNPPIYPGDKVVLIKLDYYMNDQIWDHKLLGFNVTASLYCGAQAPVLVELLFRELQCF